MARTKAKKPPLPVGTRLRLESGYEFQREGGPWVRIGDECVVVEVHEGLDGHPELGGDLADPIDGWSVVEFHGSPRARRALHHDWRKHYARLGGS